jgi:hypothetical protein
MTKFAVSPEMLYRATYAYAHDPNVLVISRRYMRAAITAAIETSGLVEALKPFAAAADFAHQGVNPSKDIPDESIVHSWGNSTGLAEITIGDFRRAKATLATLAAKG